MNQLASSSAFYTPADMAAAAEITRSENPRWRWLFPVTRTCRDHFRSQFLLLNVCYVIAVALVFVAARSDRAVDGHLMAWWLAESVVSVVVRNLLYVPIVKAAPADVARSQVLRLLPLVAVGLGVAHWAWTAAIFVGPALRLTTVVILLVFAMLSIASIAVAAASPASCLMYIVCLWSSMLVQLARSNWLDEITLTVLVGALAGILWLTYRIVVSSSRRYLVQSDEMELLVRDLTAKNAEIERLRGTAASELETRSAFFASASHDFRQRVHALKLLSMPRVAYRDGPVEVRGTLQRITVVTEELEDYMTRILEFARLERHTITPVVTDVPLQRIFQRLALQFEDIAEEAGVDLRIRATGMIVRTDAEILERILGNIVSNAIKFTRQRVLIGARRKDGDVVVDVWDCGHGIPPDSSECVFNAFYQAHGEATKVGQGVGLGLAIVKRLADAMGYCIILSSRPGSGTLFRVQLRTDSALDRN